ncbi:MAG TPA: TIGR03745 family integrating conjugative element membrane protein [Noviherbaspirillum sp.]
MSRMQLLKAAGVVALGALAMEPALAALPAAVAPPSGATAGDYIGLMKEYWKQGIAALVLIIGAYAFVMVGGGAIAKFNDYRSGKAELGDLTMYAILGVVILVTVVYLLTTAAGII